MGDLGCLGASNLWLTVGNELSGQTGVEFITRDEHAILKCKCAQAINLPGPQNIPDLVTSCGKRRDLLEGKRIHAFTILNELEKNSFLANLLIEMYRKCRRLDDARQVFSNMHKRNVFSWTVMIAAYIDDKLFAESLYLFQQMLLDGIKPDKFVFTSILDACCNVWALANGKFIHARVIESGFEADVVVGSAIVKMYVKCGTIADAEAMFQKMHQKNEVTWTTMIAAYTQHGEDKVAFHVLREMISSGVKADMFTFSTVLTLCSNLACFGEGKFYHGCILEGGAESNVVVGTALVKMYGKCGMVDHAIMSFQRIHKPNELSWTTMISVFAQLGHGKQAIQLFHKMQLQNLKPNVVTFSSSLDACAIVLALMHGVYIHACVINSSGLGSNVVVETALLNMYSNCGTLRDAIDVFRRIPKRDIISWNAIIKAYAYHGEERIALLMFTQMTEESKPDQVTFITALDACTNIESITQGIFVHSRIIGIHLESNVVLGTALINMYSKCGRLIDAACVFDEITKRDLVSWNAMVAAYVQHGYADAAFKIFVLMQQEGMKPDKITATSIISACSHSGFLCKGFHFFVTVSESHSMISQAGPHGSIIDLLGRIGWLDEARDFINGTLFEPDITTWMTLLDACKSHDDLLSAKRIAEDILQMGLVNSAASIEPLLEVRHG